MTYMHSQRNTRQNTTEAANALTSFPNSLPATAGMSARFTMAIGYYSRHTARLQSGEGKE